MSIVFSNNISCPRFYSVCANCMTYESGAMVELYWQKRT